MFTLQTTSSYLKDDFQSVLRSLSTLNLTRESAVC